jgi:hypothetical protein
MGDLTPEVSDPIGFARIDHPAAQCEKTCLLNLLVDTHCRRHNDGQAPMTFAGETRRRS